MPQLKRLELAEHFDPSADATSPETGRDPAVARAIAVLDLAFGPGVERNYDIRLWDGTTLRGEVLPSADFTLLIRRRGTLRRMLLPPSELSIVEAVISNDLDVDGSLESAIGLGDSVGKRIQSPD